MSESGLAEPVVRLRLDLAYDGREFAGWAIQPAQRTVQGVIEEVLTRITQCSIRLTVAGRTDAGVHAASQVAHFDILESIWQKYSHTLSRRLAKLLPDDVRVMRISVAPTDFDARFSALFRRYSYRVTDVSWGVFPLHRYDTLAWPRPLTISLMVRASELLLGEHDFAAYCRAREGATTIRCLQKFEWRHESDGVYMATVQADAFCHSMVRGLIGAVLAVGEGRRPVEWPASLLHLRQRAGEVVVAPAHGLTLTHVEYPPAEGLASRTQQTRQRRVLCVE